SAPRYGVAVTEPTSGRAWFRGVVAEDPVEHVDLRTEPGALDRGGFWAVVGEVEGPLHAWRFRTVRPDDAVGLPAAAPWRGPDPATWTSSLDGPGYRARVDAVRAAIREGDVYQVNLRSEERRVGRNCGAGRTRAGGS